MDDQRKSGLECVDESVGERVLNLATPALDADERELLEAHLDVCAFCRLAYDLHLRLESGIRDGCIKIKAPAVDNPVRRNSWLGWSGAAAIAASLVLMFTLPPRPVGPPPVVRGGSKVQFQRPAEGEVVKPGNVTLRWADVPGADEYRVQVTRLDDGSTWTGVSEKAQLVLPEAAVPANEERYRVILSTVPQDLLPPGGASVSFRTGGALDVTAHRARQAQPVSYLVALSGLALLIASAVGRRT